MIIQALTKFLDGRDVFEAGKGYDVDDADGYRFCALGWAKRVDGGTEPEVKKAPAEVDLAPLSVVQELPINGVSIQ